MNIELLVLRLLHIATGVFWGGSVIYLAAFVIPAVKSAGPEGGKFMQQLSRTNRLPMVMTLMPTINIVCGLRMLAIVSGGFQPAWFSSHYGMSITAGGVLGIAAFIIGFVINRPAAMKMKTISDTIAASGQPPTPDQLQALGGLRGKLEKGSNLIAWHMGATVILMSMAKYI